MIQCCLHKHSSHSGKQFTSLLCRSCTLHGINLCRLANRASALCRALGNSPAGSARGTCSCLTALCGALELFSVAVGLTLSSSCSAEGDVMHLASFLAGKQKPGPSRLDDGVAVMMLGTGIISLDMCGHRPRLLSLTTML